MEPTAFVQIARVVKVHGTKGELAVAPLEGDLDRLPVGLEVWFVPPSDRPRPSALIGVRPGPKGPLASFMGLTTPEEGRALAGTLILARRADVPPGWLSEQHFDPLGLEVSDVQRGLLGTVSDVIVTGANDVWVVTGGPVGEVLIPVIDDVVLAIDEEHGTARVKLLPGLLEEG